MRRYFFIITLFLISCKSSLKNDCNPVWAEINKVEITRDDIDNNLSVNLAELRKESVLNIVESKILEWEALSNNTTVEKNKYNEIDSKKEYPTNEMLTSFFNSKGISYDNPNADVINLARDLLTKILIEKRKIEYLDSLVKEKYNAKIFFPVKIDTNKNITDLHYNTINEGSNVNIYYIFDYSCPACIAKWPYIKHIVEKYKDKVQIHLLNYCENPTVGSKASYAADKQNKFLEMHNFLMNNSPINFYDTTLIIMQAQLLNLDIKKFKADLYGAEIEQIITFNKAELSKFGIYRIPTIYINDRCLESDISLIELDFEVTKELFYQSLVFKN